MTCAKLQTMPHAKRMCAGMKYPCARSHEERTPGNVAREERRTRRRKGAAEGAKEGAKEGEGAGAGAEGSMRTPLTSLSSNQTCTYGCSSASSTEMRRSGSTTSMRARRSRANAAVSDGCSRESDGNSSFGNSCTRQCIRTRTQKQKQKHDSFLD